MEKFMTWLKPPKRDYLLIGALAVGLLSNYVFSTHGYELLVISLLASLPTFWEAFKSLRRIKVSIDTFNSLALIISLVVAEYPSAAFIGLMLAFARILEQRTAARANKAIEELLKLKPQTAQRETGGKLTEVGIDQVKSGDILVVVTGSRVPVDGEVVYGTGLANESSVTGESAPVDKVVGDAVLSSTLLESGTLKIRATKVGEDSTIERMAALIRDATKHKSRSEKFADRFAGFFLPLVAILGIATYWYTRDARMTAALFIVACADDMAVAIPLAITASLGRAAKRGVIIKGGEWLLQVGKIKTLILDKTGTLTYGSFSLKGLSLEPGVDEKEFWLDVAIAEKFSEHTTGKIVFREAAKRFTSVPDPDEFEVSKGMGVRAVFKGKEIILGNQRITEEFNLELPESFLQAKAQEKQRFSQSMFLVFIDRKFVGSVVIADIPRKEAAESIRHLKSLGVEKVLMLTGDNKQTAADVSKTLGLDGFQAEMIPEQKLRYIEERRKDGVVAMVGDGINDAPALARVDVGIAMGGTGTAVTVETADIVILTDDLNRIPEMVELGRKTDAVIKADVAIWITTNLIGFALVLTGIAGPAIAAFYNFATDFLPLLNSTRLFKKDKKD